MEKDKRQKQTTFSELCWFVCQHSPWIHPSWWHRRAAGAGGSRGERSAWRCWSCRRQLERRSEGFRLCCRPSQTPRTGSGLDASSPWTPVARSEREKKWRKERIKKGFNHITGIFITNKTNKKNRQCMKLMTGQLPRREAEISHCHLAMTSFATKVGAVDRDVASFFFLKYTKHLHKKTTPAFQLSSDQKYDCIPVYWNSVVLGSYLY